MILHISVNYTTFFPHPALMLRVFVLAPPGEWWSARTDGLTAGTHDAQRALILKTKRLRRQQSHKAMRGLRGALYSFRGVSLKTTIKRTSMGDEKNRGKRCSPAPLPFKLGASQFLHKVSQEEIYGNIWLGGILFKEENDFPGKKNIKKKHPSNKAPVLASWERRQRVDLIFYPREGGGSSATKQSSSVGFQLHIVAPGWLTDWLQLGSAQLSSATLLRLTALLLPLLSKARSPDCPWTPQRNSSASSLQNKTNVCHNASP